MVERLKYLIALPLMMWERMVVMEVMPLLVNSHHFVAHHQPHHSETAVGLVFVQRPIRMIETTFYELRQSLVSY